MCGRYALRISTPELARILGVEPPMGTAERFNIAPTQAVPVLRVGSDGQRELASMRWGLVPHWSKGPDGKYAMFNARLEGLASKPAYRGPLRRRRCLVPADGWYEWQSLDRRKQPYFIHRPDHQPFCFAGLWDRWETSGGELLESCTIITAPAVAELHAIHPRMPMLAAMDGAGQWLDPTLENPAAALELLDRDQARGMVAEPVSTFVNNARNDDPRCCEPIALSSEGP